MRGRIARAERLHHAGKREQAIADLSTLGAEARRIDDHALVSEVALVEGKLAMDRNAWEVARAHLVDAIGAGVRGEAPARAAEAAVRKLFVDVMLSDDLERALHEAPIALALVDRAGAPAALEALFSNNTGTVFGIRGERDRARQVFARAIALGATANGLAAVDFANFHINLALVTDDATERERLFTAGRRYLTQVIGEDHVRVHQYDVLRARFTADPQAALELLHPACVEVQARLPADYRGCSECSAHEGLVLDQLGRARDAEEALGKALECFSTPVSATDRSYVDAFRAQLAGHAALLRGESAAAERYLLDAQSKWTAEPDIPWTRDKRRMVMSLLARLPREPSPPT